jgi:hypothetical protein
VVGLGLLKSYRDVGCARVSCSGRCSCPPEQFELLHRQEVSLGLRSGFIPLHGSSFIHTVARGSEISMKVRQGASLVMIFLRQEVPSSQCTVSQTFVLRMEVTVWVWTFPRPSL